MYNQRIEVMQKTAEVIAAQTGGQVLAVQYDLRDYEQVEQVLAKQ